MENKSTRPKMFGFKRQLLVNPRFQYSIIKWFCLLAVILILVFYAGNAFFFYQMQQDALAAGLPSNHVIFRYIARQNDFMNFIFLVASVLAFLIIFIGGLWISNRVAGPFYRLTLYLKNTEVDQLKPLKFRKNDYFLEVEEAFNKFVTKLTRK
jgi:hypothetical protein